MAEDSSYLETFELKCVWFTLNWLMRAAEILWVYFRMLAKFLR